MLYVNHSIVKTFNNRTDNIYKSAGANFNSVYKVYSVSNVVLFFRKQQ